MAISPAIWRSELQLSESTELYMGWAHIAPWGGDTFDHNVYPPPSW